MILRFGVYGSNIKKKKNYNVFEVVLRVGFGCVLALFFEMVILVFFFVL